MHGEFQQALRAIARSSGAIVLLCALIPLPAKLIAAAVPGGFFVDIIAALVFPAAVIRIVAAAHKGEPPSIADAIASALTKLWKLALGAIAAGMVILAGIFAFVVPAAIFACRFALMNAVIVMEDAGPVEALRRSDALTRGRRWDILFAWVVIAGTGYCITAAPTFTLLEFAMSGATVMDERTALLTTLVLLVGIVAEVLVASTLYFFYASAIERERAAVAGAAATPPIAPGDPAGKA